MSSYGESMQKRKRISQVKEISENQYLYLYSLTHSLTFAASFLAYEMRFGLYLGQGSMMRRIVSQKPIDEKNDSIYLFFIYTYKIRLQLCLG